MKRADLCREHGISAATFYGWQQEFGGMDVSEAQRLKSLGDENRRLKLLVGWAEDWKVGLVHIQPGNVIHPA